MQNVKCKRKKQNKRPGSRNQKPETRNKNPETRTLPTRTSPIPMIPSLRQEFNRTFSESKYRLLLQRLDALCGTHIEFRVSETPVFIPPDLMQEMVQSGAEIVMQLMKNPAYLKKSSEIIPPEFRVPHEDSHPLFVAVDFGITRDADGRFSPKLIELQGFPTLFGFQAVLSQQFKEVYGLPHSLTSLLGGIDFEQYLALMRKAIVGEHDPEQVILLELDPERQKTRCDFILTGHFCGIRTVNIRDLVRQGRSLFYMREGRTIPVARIFNRAIVDELVRERAALPFDFRDDLDVAWAGHPNWFFRLSKFSLPFLDHPAVPKTHFLHELSSLPGDLSRWVLKPLFSFAGSGVKVGPSVADIGAIPIQERSRYILQEMVDYGGFVETPHGGTKAEIRIIYFWLDELRAVNNLVRLGRGRMMGVDFNKNMAWVGSSAGLVPAE